MEKDAVNMLRRLYRRNRTVCAKKAVKTTDGSTVPAGDFGTVTYVTVKGFIKVKWDNGLMSESAYKSLSLCERPENNTDK